MSKRYEVTLVKKEAYEVEASNEDEAIKKACELCDYDKWAFFDPVDEFEIKEID